MLPLLIVFLTIMVSVEAFSVEATFKTTCSLPNTTTHYVSSPDTRGTLNILWSSFFTVIACTFTIQHLNVPEQREGRDPGWRGDIKWSLKDFWRSLKWMLITIIAPEMLIGKGASDFWTARGEHPRLKAFAEEDRVPWTFTHTLFANMGGFVIRRNIPRNPFHLTASDIIIIREARHLIRLPYVTEDEIHDKSKSSKFVKTLAITQITWTIVQILIRSTKRLAVTQLEIAVLAFTASAVIIYFLNWRKPKDVKTPYTLMSYPEAIPDDIILRLGTKHSYRETLSTVTGFNRQRIRAGDPVPNDYDERDDVSALTICIGCIIFCGIHLGAWNFIFPTRVDLILWRVASVWCTAWPATLTLCVLPISYISERIITHDPRSTTVGTALEEKTTQVLVFLYVIGRLILLVEIFRTLLFLPLDAFVATWASNIPHIS